MRVEAFFPGLWRSVRLVAGLAVCLAVVLAVLIAYYPAAADATPAAALLRVAYAGVEVQRGATEAWIAVQQGAEFPVGAGDRIRTSRVGRVNLFWRLPAGTQPTDTASMSIMLPNTEVLIAGLRGDDITGIDADLLLERGSLITGLDPAAFAAFAVRTPRGDLIADVLTGPVPRHVAVQYTEETTTAIVLNGTASFIPTDVERETLTVDGTQAVLVGEEQFLRLPVPALPNFVQVQAASSGCAGLVASRGGLNLNVRVGPLFNYDELGTIPNGDTVRVVAISSDRARYRIAYRSSYGWVITEGVETVCDRIALPVLPFSQVETITPAIGVLADELPVLVPFYGSPQDDLWFYS